MEQRAIYHTKRINYKCLNFFCPLQHYSCYIPFSPFFSRFCFWYFQVFWESEFELKDFAFKAGALPLEPHLHTFYVYLALFFRWGRCWLLLNPSQVCRVTKCHSGFSIPSLYGFCWFCYYLNMIYEWKSQRVPMPHICWLLAVGHYLEDSFQIPLSSVFRRQRVQSCLCSSLSPSLLPVWVYWYLLLMSHILTILLDLE
jgi:hypothetical protein